MLQELFSAGLGWVTNTILAVMLLRVAADVEDVESQCCKTAKATKACKTHEHKPEKH